MRLTLGLLLVASACSRPPAPSEQPLRLAHVGTVVSLDPLRSGWALEARLIEQIADGLVEMDAHLQLQPSLAESWEVLDEGSRYRFRLRPDATWGAGRPLRSEDVVRALSRLAEKDAPFGWAVFGQVEGAEAYRDGRAPAITGLRALDPRTVEIQLRAPSGRFLGLLAGGVARILPGEGTGPQWAAGQIDGTGPFRLVSTEDATSGAARIRRYRFEGRAGAHGAARIGRLEWDIYGSAADLARGLSGTAYDIVYAPPSIPDGSLAGLQARSVYRFAFLSLYFDCEKAPLDRRAARRALVLGADRDAPLRGGSGPRVPGTLPEDALLPADPAAARIEARAAGLDPERPAPLRVAYSQAAEYGDVSGWLRGPFAASLAPLGFAVEVVGVPDGAALDERFYARADHAYVYGSTPELADPCLFFEPFRTGNLAYNWSWYSRPEVDAAYAACAASSSERVQRDAIRRARDLVAGDAPHLPLGPAVQRIFQSARVRGFTPTPLEGLSLRRVSLADR